MPISTVFSILLLVGGLLILRGVAKHFGISRRSIVDQFRDRPRRSGSTADTEEVETMSASIARMEERINTLERILDAEDPKWRSRL